VRKSRRPIAFARKTNRRLLKQRSFSNPNHLTKELKRNKNYQKNDSAIFGIESPVVMLNGAKEEDIFLKSGNEKSR